MTSQRKFHLSGKKVLFSGDTVSVHVMGQKTTALSTEGRF